MSPPDRPDDEVARAEAAAKAAVQRLFPDAPLTLSPAEGGLSNHVFHVEAGSDALVVRLGPAETRRQVFASERAAIEQAREAAIPAPEVLALDEAEGFAIMIARRLPGEIATDHPERLRTLRDLGALAARRIHTIRAKGFGHDPDARGGPRSWRDWLMNDLDAEGRLMLLRKHDLITAEREKQLEAVLEAVAAWTGEPVLNHGDLRLKNVLVDADGSILGLIDWEHSVSAIGPNWDLSVALHDLGVDQMQAFLEGYGLSEDAVRDAAPSWRLFNALNYIPEVERALAEGDDDALERIRTRFSGALDIFGEG